MGWTGIYEKPADPKAYVLKGWEFENERGKSEVVAASKVGSVVYAAVKQTYTNGAPAREIYEIVDNAVTFGVVILTQNRRGEFLWKDMDETALPYNFGCPAKIIKLLSPITGTGQSAENARKWREACLAKRTVNQNAAKMVVGTKIKFRKPLNFRGVPADTFQRTMLNRRGRKLNVFWNDRVGYCRIPLQNYKLGEDYDLA